MTALAERERVRCRRRRNRACPERGPALRVTASWYDTHNLRTNLLLLIGAGHVAPSRRCNVPVRGSGRSLVSPNARGSKCVCAHFTSHGGQGESNPGASVYMRKRPSFLPSPLTFTDAANFLSLGGRRPFLDELRDS